MKRAGRSSEHLAFDALGAGQFHTPVMLDEVLGLIPAAQEGFLVVDCTVGAAGHAAAILEKFPSCRYIGIDADPEALKRAESRLERFSGRFEPVPGFFDEVLESYMGDTSEARRKPNFILFDLGLSMHQYADPSRGFSYSDEASLDMRLSPSLSTSAADLVNSLGGEELANIIYTFGEERYSRRIAKAIVEARKITPITSSARLSDIVFGAVPPDYRHGRIHPATRTLQALRIAVNSELDRERAALKAGGLLLEPGGILAVISFHSLEDRIAKQELKGLCQERGFENLFRKPLLPTSEEVRANPASRSAKLRAVRAPAEMGQGQWSPTVRGASGSREMR